MKKTILKFTQTALFAALLLAGLSAHAQQPFQRDGYEGWCNSTVQDLRDAKQDATRVARYGDYATAAKILVDAFKFAANDPYAWNRLYTRKALNRGVQLYTLLHKTMALAQNGGDTEVYFLQKYASFIIHTSETMDKRTIIDAYDRCWGLCGAEAAAQEDLDNRVEFAKQEVSVILESFTTSRGNAIYPVGNTAAFANLVGQSAQYAIADLIGSRYATYFVCSIRGLEKITTFISNGGYGQSYQPETVARIYNRTSEYLEGVDGNCGGPRGGYEQ